MISEQVYEAVERVLECTWLDNFVIGEKLAEFYSTCRFSFRVCSPATFVTLNPYHREALTENERVLFAALQSMAIGAYLAVTDQGFDREQFEEYCLKPLVEKYIKKHLLSKKEK